MRRILTAREQVAQLTPWRVATLDWDIRHSAGDRSGSYTAYDPATGDKAGHLNYHRYQDTDSPAALLNGIHTEEPYLRHGLATTLIRRLHDDYPDHVIDFGPRSDDGDALYQQLLTRPDMDYLKRGVPKTLKEYFRGHGIVVGDPQPIQGPRTANREDYGGVHEPPGPDQGFPFHDITSSLPEDMYDHLHYWPGDDSPGAKESFRHLRRARGNPEHPVDIYRALPHGNGAFNTGDWVTTSLDYARSHAMHPTDPAQDWPVIKSTVPARHLWGNGDMLQEYGYHGPSHDGTVI